jgi:hypothetical protein
MSSILGCDRIPIRLYVRRRDIRRRGLFPRLFVFRDDVPPRTATAERPGRSATAKNSPPPANVKEATSPATDKISPTPGIGKLSPSQEPAANYDGFTVGIDDGEETGQPLPIRPRPAKQSKVRQKPDTTEGPSAIQSLDDSEVEKLKPKLTICRGC